MASTPGYTPETLFNETQAKYTALLNQGLWWPSDKTPVEQALAMDAQQQQTKKSSTNPTKSKPNSPQGSKTMEKDKKSPPFANTPGKLGNTKQWNGKTYYWRPTNHKHSHGHTHKVEECNTYKKMVKNKKNPTMMTKRKLPWTKTNSKRKWWPSSLPATSTLMIWLKLLLLPLRVLNDSSSCGSGAHLCL